jgi:hypothetical protein
MERCRTTTNATGGPAARRALLSLVLAATVLFTALGAPTPAGAQSPTGQDAPAARVQLLLQSVKIIDDRDGLLAGDGEMRFWMELHCQTAASDPCPEHEKGAVDIVRSGFDAGSGDTKVLNLAFPLSTSRIPFFPRKPAAEAAAKIGYALSSDRAYQFRFSIYERDGIVSLGELMGAVTMPLTQVNGWAIGTYTQRSVRFGTSEPGDFELTFEIRRMPFPDLQVTGIKVEDLPGELKERVCTSVQNLANVDAGPFEVALSVDGTVPADGRINAPGLGAGQRGDWCVETQILAGAERKLEAVVDGANALLEFDEANNALKQTYSPASVTMTPVPSQSTTRAAAQADLQSTVIRVNGQSPDGKDDCKAGKNAVAVVVKNTGTADASGFAVRLVVDGAESSAFEQAVQSLEAGKEREVRFEGVELKKGEHKLTALADSNRQVTETNEENNALTATARCSG